MPRASVDLRHTEFVSPDRFYQRGPRSSSRCAIEQRCLSSFCCGVAELSWPFYGPEHLLPCPHTVLYFRPWIGQRHLRE